MRKIIKIRNKLVELPFIVKVVLTIIITPIIVCLFIGILLGSYLLLKLIIELDWNWIWIHIMTPILGLGFSMGLFFAIYQLLFKKE